MERNPIDETVPNEEPQPAPGEPDDDTGVIPDEETSLVDEPSVSNDPAADNLEETE